MTVSDIDVTNADHLLTTTRSVRRRLDFERPVPPPCPLCPLGPDFVAPG